VTWQIVIVDEVRGLASRTPPDRPRHAPPSRAVLNNLEVHGPGLGRPLVDTIKGSSLRNLKELRPGSSGASEVRMLFAFDPDRNAVILVAGDKAGNWTGWYKDAIPLAEERYRKHLEADD
jgi:hypothetical protein